jgi:hypothetical protein
MNRQRIVRWGLLLLALALAPGLVALAQEGGGLSPATDIYDLDWHTVDGGGGASTGGIFTLNGTAGQPDAGLLTGGVYTLTGGYWGGATATILSQRVYLPLVLK